MRINVIQADYDNEDHAKQVVRLTDIYARDPMGNDEPLPASTQVRLIDELKKSPNALSMLAFHNELAVGLANCFIHLSTFEAKKVINIHDLVVMPEYRGIGIGEKLLDKVQEKAHALNCCRLTLEVRDDNPAKWLYERFGFENDEPAMWFMVKDIY